MIKNIVFDLGGVLIDWDPRYMYRKVFSSEDQMEHFLNTVCTSAWNEEQDAGRTLAEGTNLLVEAFPEHKREIHMFYDRWEEMLNGAIENNLAVFRQLRDTTDYPIYALTNWSAETMPMAIPHFGFLSEFDGMIVSGQEGVKKPDLRIYQILMERYQIRAVESVFLDDNEYNIRAADGLGFSTVLVRPTTDIAAELRNLQVKF